MSNASRMRCLASTCCLCICRLAARCEAGLEPSATPPSVRLAVSPSFVGMSLMTPVASQGVLNGNFLPADSGSSCAPSLRERGDFTIDDPSSDTGLFLDVAAGVPIDAEVFLLDGPLGCLLVTPPLTLLISSMSWTPSGALGFLSLMYRSRCRPRDEEVKAWWQ